MRELGKKIAHGAFCTWSEHVRPTPCTRFSAHGSISCASKMPGNALPDVSWQCKPAIPRPRPRLNPAASCLLAFLRPACTCMCRLDPPPACMQLFRNARARHMRCSRLRQLSWTKYSISRVCGLNLHGDAAASRSATSVPNLRFSSVHPTQRHERAPGMAEQRGRAVCATGLSLKNARAKCNMYEGTGPIGLLDMASKRQHAWRTCKNAAPMHGDRPQSLPHLLLTTLYHGAASLRHYKIKRLPPCRRRLIGLTSPGAASRGKMQACGRKNHNGGPCMQWASVAGMH